MNQLLGNTDTVKKIITWSSQFSENFLEVGVIFLSVFCVKLQAKNDFLKDVESIVACKFPWKNKSSCDW